MKTFKQHYTDTQFNNVINEQLTSNASEDVIVENISNIFINESIGTPIEALSRFDGSAVSQAISDPEYVNNALDAAGVFPDGGLIGLFPNPLEWLAGAGLSVIAVKVIAKILEKILAKSNAKADKAAAISDVEGESTFNDKVQDAIKRGDALTDEEKQQLANDISDKLTEKYPNREKAWWLKALNAITKFLKGKGGAGLALLGYFLI